MPNKLYIGNLNYATTEATLSDIFGEVGEVVSVNLVTDRMTGRSRGFAFVEMVDEDTAKQAVTQLNGREVDERAIKVEEARPQRPRGDRRGSRRY